MSATPETQALTVEAGQFDDAPEDNSTAVDPRAGHAYVDEVPPEEDKLLEWSSASESEDQDEFAEAFQTLRAEDEDWEIAERDFTKQYNRVRQHVAVRTGAAQGVTSSMDNRAAVASLPAVNRPKQTAKASSSTVTRTMDKTEDQLQALSKYSSRLRNIDMPYDLGVGVNRKGPSSTANMKDKSDRATSEQVLDPRTRIILFKMIGRGLLYEVNGCVSTGKEANVYHAVTPERRHLALKIYKTSILVFKDRDKYVTGEYRFRRGYSRHNPRKMVRVWAEKEMRNLKRLVTAGIRCPEPVEVRENVLVMGFVGDREGWASPRLKDAEIPESVIPELYVELLLMTRKMFVECKLVHADLSEYNILYHVEDTTPLPTQAPPHAASNPADPPPPSSEASAETVHTQNENTEPTRGANADTTAPQGHLYIIDVSQSVEHDHPHAFDFLRADLRNVEDFFAKRGVPAVGLRRAFEFVTRESLVPPGSAEDPAAVLRRWMEEPDQAPADADGEERSGDEGQSRADAAQEDAVFMRSYIPRTLNEVYDPERDVGALSRGEGAQLIYKDVIGLVTREDAAVEKSNVQVKTNGTKVRFEDDVADEGSGKTEDEGDSSADEDEESDGDPDAKGALEERRPRGHRHEDKEAKKVRLRGRAYL
ncbi:RIO1 family-domain-containing protein [Fomitopsis serialis]|uniref:RIO1 family-domain-containing protein n=1 Tax=Fomitopsis serialis TaxID=139415 RepID=UPI0020081DC2|nr:RIO1 family-domain-containing protein [Neoantrodia serialis]KAH9936381.1 RIO1 family-domain-containing protein [Neoantrodia serialis]